MTEDERQRRLAEGLMAISETLDAVLEAVSGYRTRCEAAGFSKEAAEQMAVQYHARLVAVI